MAGKKVPAKLTKGTLFTAALALVQQALASEEVRRRLASAPADVIHWASTKRAEHRDRDAHEVRRLDPTGRFGQRGLERRVGSLKRAIELGFPGANDAGRAEMLHAIDGLTRALAVAASLPLVKRKRAHARIDSELDALELAMVDAVLPTPGNGHKELR